MTTMVGLLNRLVTQGPAAFKRVVERGGYSAQETRWAVGLLASVNVSLLRQGGHSEELLRCVTGLLQPSGVSAEVGRGLLIAAAEELEKICTGDRQRFDEAIAYARTNIPPSLFAPPDQMVAQATRVLAGEGDDSDPAEMAVGDRLFYEKYLESFAMFKPLLSRQPVLPTKAGTLAVSVIFELLPIFRDVLRQGDYFVDLGSGLGGPLAVASHFGGHAIGVEFDPRLCAMSLQFLDDLVLKASALPAGCTEFDRTRITVLNGDFMKFELANMGGRIPTSARRVYFYYIEGSGAMRQAKSKRLFLERLQSLPKGSQVILYSLGLGDDGQFRDASPKEISQYLGRPMRTYKHRHGFFTNLYSVKGK